MRLNTRIAVYIHDVAIDERWKKNYRKEYNIRMGIVHKRRIRKDSSQQQQRQS